MTSLNYILATAGHVDHGKSSLVKALTDTDPDRLPEEKERGITMDLGFASLHLDGEGCEYHLGVIDVPGHEDFVKNMVAGVGSIDLALIVVAADDCWMPQTEEHLQILSYLGVTRAVVAVTKIDLTDAEPELAIEMVREELSGTLLEGAPIVGTSVVTGEGLEELKRAIVGVLAATPVPADLGKPRLPVDRVFTLKGIGTVVTGTLTGGTLGRGQSVCLQPSGKTSRLRSIQAHHADVDSIGPGTRCAVNLPDLANDSAHGSGDVVRGDIVMLDGSGVSSDAIDVLLERSARLNGGQYCVNRPLKNGTRVRVHFGSGNLAARIQFRDRKDLLPGECGIAELRLEVAGFVMAGDRFIVRDWPEQATLAGGIILDERAEPRRFRSEAQGALLEARAADLSDSGVWIASQLKRDVAVRAEDLLRQSRFGNVEIRAAVASLVECGAAMERAEFVVDADAWEAVVMRMAGLIDEWHRIHPEQQGLLLTEARTALGGKLCSVEASDLVLTDLCESGFVRRAAVIAREAHRASLPADLMAAAESLRSALSVKPMEPPGRKELDAGAGDKGILKFLIESGEVVEINPEIVMLRSAFDSMSGAIVGWLDAHGAATVSELRQVAGTSRRIILPVLDYLDRERITIRDGDRRRLMI